MAASSRQAYPSATHLITLPLPSPQQPTVLVAHTTHFTGKATTSSREQSQPATAQSLFVWCGDANARASMHSLPSQAETQPQSSLLEEASYAPPLAEAADEQRTSDKSNLAALESQPTGFLMREWAIAMSRASSVSSITQQPVMSTSLFHTNTDLAKPMAARLAKRFNIPQLLLTLSLPEELLASIEGPFAGPEGSRALLILEGALGQVIEEEMRPAEG